jgi:hypothetical protein
MNSLNYVFDSLKIRSFFTVDVSSVRFFGAFGMILHDVSAV